MGRQGAIGSLMGGWANNDSEAARQWVMSNLQGESRNRALGAVIQTVAHRDFQEAARMYEEATANLPVEIVEKTMGHVASQITSSWSNHDPAGASEWLMSQPEGKQRTKSIEQLGDNWGDYDLDGAATFVLTLGEGNERDQAVERLVRDIPMLRTQPASVRHAFRNQAILLTTVPVLRSP
jgi:hypothetical protein